MTTYATARGAVLDHLHVCPDKRARLSELATAAAIVARTTTEEAVAAVGDLVQEGKVSYSADSYVTLMPGKAAP